MMHLLRIKLQNVKIFLIFQVICYRYHHALHLLNNFPPHLLILSQYEILHKSNYVLVLNSRGHRPDMGVGGDLQVFHN